MTTGSSVPEKNRLDGDVAAAIWLAEQSTSTAVMARLAAHGFNGLTPQTLSIVDLLDSNGATRASLAERAGLSRPALNRLARSLIELGYLEQISGSNGARVPRVRPTAKGIALGAACRKIRIEVQTLVAETLGEDGAARLSQHLQKLRAVFAAIASSRPAGIARPPAKRLRRRAKGDDKGDGNACAHCPPE